MEPKGTQTVIPPDAPLSSSKSGNLIPGKAPRNVVLTTPGQVKSEMARIYRAMLKGKVSQHAGRGLIRDALLPILKATEIEQAFRLAPDDPDADRPAMTGLTITGPDVTLAEGSPVRRLDGKQPEPTRTEKDHDEERDDQGQPADSGELEPGA